MENVKVVEKETSDIIVQIKYLVIKSQTEYEDAADYLRRVKNNKTKLKNHLTQLLQKRIKRTKKLLGKEINI